MTEPQKKNAYQKLKVNLIINIVNTKLISIVININPIINLCTRT